MNRRTLLAGTGAAFLAAVAGCLDGGAPGGGGGNGTGGNGTETDDGDPGTGTDDPGTGDDAVDPIPEDPRTDAPPYVIEPPEPPDTPGDGDAWNDDYFGENMPTEPSLRVEAISVPRGRLRDPLRDHADPGEDGYRARLLTSESDVEDNFNTDAMDDDAVDRLRSVEFEDAVVVAVESGFGSGSVSHRWARAEADGSVLGLHGYYTDPYIQTDDITSWLSVLEIERPPDGIEYARVSLTVAEDRRVHLNSTEGVVTPE